MPNAHLRSVHDLRNLEHRIMNDWRMRIDVVKILQSAAQARARVESDLRAAETAYYGENEHRPAFARRKA